MNRVIQIKTQKLIMKMLAAIALGLILFFEASSPVPAGILEQFRNPPPEFSVMPFWFWNDDLKDEELVRQIADFEAHGVYGFVIHPRIGLPEDIGWMSPRMIHIIFQPNELKVLCVSSGSKIN